MLILIMKGQSQYEGTRTFADLAADAMRRAGHEVVVDDLTVAANLRERIEELALQYRPDLLFTINILGEFRSEERTLAGLFRAPHVLWHTDYVFNHTERLVRTAAETALLMVDPTQIEGVHSVFGAARHPNITFFPHPAACEPAPDDADLDAYAARPIPLLWSGTCHRPEIPWKQSPPKVQKLFETALDHALKVEWAPPHEILDRVLADAGVDLSDPANAGSRTACRHIDTVVRTTRRFAFVKALAKTGLPVTICGDNWKDQLYRFKNVTYLGPQPMPKVVELMRQSRVVLNNNGNFGGGSHERPFTILLSGALPFTDTSRYYEQVFEDGEDIAMFRWMDLPTGLDRLRRLIDHPEEAYPMVQKGKAKALRDHTWDARLPIIFAAAEACPAP
ncbi:MAG: glycosyltransferase [Alphaproteobacteria bacterium]|nr:glycosyltransferase [Alphaproteobacteria bacterium]MBU2269714.1 glycosyltransferase [Alphaproteobacteria bacterium]MBU2419755.1 glycosyltransferase [Alphaproteobacteria bacterium]